MRLLAYHDEFDESQNTLVLAITRSAHHLMLHFLSCRLRAKRLPQELLGDCDPFGARAIAIPEIDTWGRQASHDSFPSIGMSTAHADKHAPISWGLHNDVQLRAGHIASCRTNCTHLQYSSTKVWTCVHHKRVRMQA